MKSLLPRKTWVTPVSPPPLSIHPKKVQLLIKRLRTPQDVQAWLNSLVYNDRETMTSLHRTHRYHRAHCLEGAVAAATILEYHGYPPLILDVQSADLLDHTLFLYRDGGRLPAGRQGFGTIGKSRDIGLGGRRPVYRNLHSLVQSYAAPYIDRKAKIIGYGILDLRTVPRSDWRTSIKNLWWLESVLEDAPHRTVHSSPTFVHYWRQCYLDFKKVHPQDQPDYFPNQQNWM